MKKKRVDKHIRQTKVPVMLTISECLGEPKNCSDTVLSWSNKNYRGIEKKKKDLDISFIISDCLGKPGKSLTVSRKLAKIFACIKRGAAAAHND